MPDISFLPPLRSPNTKLEEGSEDDRVDSVGPRLFRSLELTVHFDLNRSVSKKNVENFQCLQPPKVNTRPTHTPMRPRRSFTVHQPCRKGPTPCRVNVTIYVSRRNQPWLHSRELFLEWFVKRLYLLLFVLS